MGLTLNQFEIKQEQALVKAAETKAWRSEQISEWLKENPERKDLLAWLNAELDKGWHEFYNSLLRYFEKNGKLTEGQEAAAWKSKAREEKWEQEKAQEAAQASPAPTGRIEVTGTILSTKWVDSQWGGTEKMVVKADEGFRFYCTVPSDISFDEQLEDGTILPSAKVGDKIKLTVTLTPSDNDETFAWGKRPSKAEIIERA